MAAQNSVNLADLKAAPRRANSSLYGASRVEKLLENNKTWSNAVLQETPHYFDGLQAVQSPEYLWIGCADSRVPANTILGLQPGEVFVQRNVGNQANHQDMNCMSCLEYAVKELRVKTVIVCGHYNCGAVKAALRLPSKTPGLVNCWISDIRACRNEHQDELKALGDNEQIQRLCELNVLRQTFHVCTSPVVQAAWDDGQELEVFGLIYSLRDGRLKSLVGPLRGNNDFAQDLSHFVDMLDEEAGTQATIMRVASGCSLNPGEADDMMEQLINTAAVASKLAQHAAWTDPNAPQNDGTSAAPLTSPRTSTVGNTALNNAALALVRGASSFTNRMGGKDAPKEGKAGAPICKQASGGSNGSHSGSIPILASKLSGGGVAAAAAAELAADMAGMSLGAWNSNNAGSNARTGGGSSGSSLVAGSPASSEDLTASSGRDN